MLLNSDRVKISPLPLRDPLLERFGPHTDPSKLLDVTRNRILNTEPVRKLSCVCLILLSVLDCLIEFVTCGLSSPRNNILRIPSAHHTHACMVHPLLIVKNPLLLRHSPLSFDRPILFPGLRARRQRLQSCDGPISIDLLF